MQPRIACRVISDHSALYCDFSESSTTLHRTLCGWSQQTLIRYRARGLQHPESSYTSSIRRTHICRCPPCCPRLRCCLWLPSGERGGAGRDDARGLAQAAGSEPAPQTIANGACDSAPSPTPRHHHHHHHDDDAIANRSNCSNSTLSSTCSFFPPVLSSSFLSPSFTHPPSHPPNSPHLSPLPHLRFPNPRRPNCAAVFSRTSRRPRCRCRHASPWRSR